MIRKRQRFTFIFASAVSAALSLLAVRDASAEDPTISVEARLEPSALSLGQRAKLAIDISIPDKFHLWTFDPGSGPLALTIAFSPGSPLELEGPWHGDLPERGFFKGFNAELENWGKARVHLERAVRLAKEPGEGSKIDVRLQVRGQICTDEVCVPQRIEVKVPFTYESGLEKADAPVALKGVLLREPNPNAAPVAQASQVAVTSPSASASASGATDPEASLLVFLLLAFVAGIGALATPCVFPAIPLTISFFSKYSEENFARGARLAAVFSLTMIATFTTFGVVVSLIFGAAGIQAFASHPVFNLALAIVLLFFALNLLGLFEIQVPNWMLTATNKLESKLGRSSALATGRKKGSAADYIIVSVAAVTATTVFFTCTVGFVGPLIAAASRGEWFWPTIGMAGFSSGFALLFFFLGMFPQAAKRLRGKAGGWLTLSRVTFGFLELAASLKFLSNADLVWKWNLVTREAVLAIWVPLFALCGLYLLGKLKFGEEVPEESENRISVVRVVLAIGVFAVSLHLAVGLFNKRSFGGWIDGLLPPMHYPGTVVAESGAGGVTNGPRFKWIHDLQAGRTRAKESKQLVFVNYTGYTCTNCRYMEEGVFPAAEVAPLLDRMVLVELYTDDGSAENERNRDDQVARFGTAALPFYSVERPDGEVCATFASSTNVVAEFVEFLKKGMERCAGAPVPAPAPVEVLAGAPISLDTERLNDGAKSMALAPGKWMLVNFWASYCAPCIVELKEFLIKRGQQLESDGGKFAIVAVEEDDGLEAARRIAKEVGMPPALAFRIKGDAPVDPKLQFGGSLPHTVLIAPTGEVVWTHSGALTSKELDDKLRCHIGDKPAAVYVARKC